MINIAIPPFTSKITGQLQDQNTQSSPIRKEFQRAVSLLQDLVSAQEDAPSRRLKKSSLLLAQTRLEPVVLDDRCTVPDILDVDLENVTTLEERLAQPEYQPFNKRYSLPSCILKIEQLDLKIEM
jgi:hypothetical protein